MPARSTDPENIPTMMPNQGTFLTTVSSKSKRSSTCATIH